MAQKAEISELLDRLGRFTHALQFSQGLNPVQWEALRFIARANRFSRTPSALADYLTTTKGTISQTLISLEGKGFIKRTRDLADRRSVRISLTEHGREVLRKDPLRALDQAGSRLSPAEYRTLTDGMSRLFESLARSHGLSTFGICAECAHFQPADGHDADGRCFCDFTVEMLNDDDFDKVCVNFEPAR